MNIDFTTIYNDLNFLTESIRLQYTNFIWRNKDRLNEYLSYDDVIYRLRMEEPIEYVFNMAEFCDTRFYVDKRSLIPRPETQEIINKTIGFIQENPQSNFTIIDVGTGSGCIILSIAKKLKEKSMDKHTLIGIDVSDDALEVARINRTALDLISDVSLLCTPFQEFDFTPLKNLIVCSNLPYIPNNDEIQKSVLDHEPHIALFGGEKGDELNKQLINILKNSVNLQVIFMEGYNGEITTIMPPLP